MWAVMTTTNSSHAMRLIYHATVCMGIRGLIFNSAHEYSLNVLAALVKMAISSGPRNRADVTTIKNGQ
jgi:hypothetical protein